MLNIKINNLFPFIVFLLFITISSLGQEMMFEVPLSEQVKHSTQIIEGKVISKKSFWDINHHNIYTINTVEVYKSFKGIAHSTLEIITEGGVVDTAAQITSLALELVVGDMGVFMLYGSNVQFSPENNIGANRYESYSAIQGFYKYDIFDDRVANSYTLFNGISQKFYPSIVSYVNSNFVKVSEFDIDNYINTRSQNRMGAIAISSFSPTTITGGTKSVLTIDGAGFGSETGEVIFRDANIGGQSSFTALTSQIISWTDTQIKVEVPSRAGTGKVRVVRASIGSVNSTANLEIPYSELNIITDEEVAYQTQHVDNNGSGSYIWTMSNSFFINVPANQSFT